MPVQYLLTRVALPLRRVGLLSVRSLGWSLRVTPQGRLCCRCLRLRFYGVSLPDDVAQYAGRLGTLLNGGRCRWRILAIDGDGTLAVLVRIGGVNLVQPLLRDGLVSLRGGGSGPLRAAQEAARRERRGIWRFAEEWQSPRETRVLPGVIIFPWWQA